MMTRLHNPRLFVVSGMILLAALSRLLPHWPNFTAVGAMALFGAAYFERRSLALVVPLAALYLSDLLLNNIVYADYYAGFTWRISPWVYVSFILVACIGFLLRGRVRPLTVVGGSLSASAVFFLVTNFGSWMVDPLFSKDAAGLMMAYTAGLPFFWNTLAGDLFFSGVLFGAFAWAQKRSTALAGHSPA